MPKASKQTASEHETVEGYEGHFEHFEGGWTVGFETYTQDADLAPFFKGLPDDQCQCEHLGSVIKGKLAFRSGEEEEVFEAGDAYYGGPGHTPVLFAGTEVVEFSRTVELARMMEVVTKNMDDRGRVLLIGCPGARRLGARDCIRDMPRGPAPVRSIRSVSPREGLAPGTLRWESRSDRPDPLAESGR
jgi:hypothetical protein